MHVVLGILTMVSAFGLSFLAHNALPFFGLFNPAAMVLLGLGPLAASLFSYPLGEWQSVFGVLRRAFAHGRARSLGCSG